MSSGKKKRRSKGPHRPYKPPGQWDLLNNTLNALVDYAKLPTTVAPMLRNPEVVEKVADRPLLINRAKLLCEDCGSFTKELLEIKQKHDGRRGAAKNPDDNATCIDIHSEYIDWAERYEAVVYPTYLDINEQVGSAIGLDMMQIRPTAAVAAANEGKEE